MAYAVERATDLASRLLEHLREALAAPGLQFAEPPTGISGGFDTQIVAFRLEGAPPGFSGPLILRLLGAHAEPARALRERAVQNTLADLGYPVPRVLLATSDPAPLGLPGLIMERVPGRPLLETRVFGLARVLVELQLRLHALDAQALRQALDEEGRTAVSMDGLLARLEDRIVGGSLDGLRPAMAWLIDHRPPPASRPAICHGDFHPQNILVSGGSVSGVIDWPNTVIADPAYDVAATLVILRFAPPELPAPIRWLAGVARRTMATRYLAGYRRRHPLDSRTLAYYEALGCMRGLSRTAEGRLRRGTTPPNPLDMSAFGETLAVHFARITGIAPALPPPRRR
ncbi:MAG TPA: phosphotransferase [Methylomirabilota bacterium]|jgi:aminoglycoside phosphotransferase (APT) family kinase protein|nr:phosphotransferase [Methylomirabilota bacterium]